MLTLCYNKFNFAKQSVLQNKPFVTNSSCQGLVTIIVYFVKIPIINIIFETDFYEIF